MSNPLITKLDIAALMLQQPTPSDNPSIWGHLSSALRLSLDRVLSLFVSILPGILAFFLALALFALVGLILSAILRRGLIAAHFDERIERTHGKVDWAPSGSVTSLIAAGSFWACILLGLMIGVSAFDASYAASATMPFSLVPYFTHAVGAAFLLIAGTLIARFLARSVLIGAVNAQLQYARFLSLGVKWLILVLTAAMVLDHLEVGGNIVELAFGILFGGIVLTLALAVGLGSRELVSRSLDSHVEHNPERPNSIPDSPIASETIHHF